MARSQWTTWTDSSCSSEFSSTAASPANLAWYSSSDVTLSTVMMSWSKTFLSTSWRHLMMSSSTIEMPISESDTTSSSAVRMGNVMAGATGGGRSSPAMRPPAPSDLRLLIPCVCAGVFFFDTKTTNTKLLKYLSIRAV